jgi:hypothetical protein
MKLLIMPCSPTSRYFLPLRSNCSPQHLILKHPPSLYSYLNMRNEPSHPYKTTGETVFFYILIFMSLDSRWDNKRFWTECKKAFPKWKLLLMFSWIFRFLFVISKYLNFVMFSNNLLANFILWSCPAFWWWNKNIYLSFPWVYF